MSTAEGVVCNVCEQLFESDDAYDDHLYLTDLPERWLFCSAGCHDLFYDEERIAKDVADEGGAGDGHLVQRRGVDSKGHNAPASDHHEAEEEPGGDSDRRGDIRDDGMGELRDPEGPDLVPLKPAEDRTDPRAKEGSRREVDGGAGLAIQDAPISPETPTSAGKTRKRGLRRHLTRLPRPEPFSNPTRAWQRGLPGSRGGSAARGPRGELRQGYVYFFQGDTTRRIKIGFSSAPERRLAKEIRKGASERMRLLGFVAGTTQDEAKLHRTNAGSHVLDEWFTEDVLPEVARHLGRSVEELEEIPFG
jgi:hypothetical protein